MIYIALIAIVFAFMMIFNVNARLSRIEKRLKFDEDAGEKFE